VDVPDADVSPIPPYPRTYLLPLHHHSSVFHPRSTPQPQPAPFHPAAILLVLLLQTIYYFLISPTPAPPLFLFPSLLYFSFLYLCRPLQQEEDYDSQKDTGGDTIDVYARVPAWEFPFHRICWKSQLRRLRRL